MNNAWFKVRSGQCEKCGQQVDAHLHKKLCSDLHLNFAYVCPSCGKVGCFGGQMWIPKDAVTSRLTQEEIDALPSLEDSVIQICVRCKKPGAQYHHWAPREMFEDAELWPQDLLCVECHKLWHDTVRNFYQKQLPPCQPSPQLPPKS